MNMSAAIQNVRDWYAEGGPVFVGPSRAVEVGDRFYKTAGPRHLWRVTRVFRPTDDGPPHAVMVRDGGFQDRTVIAIDALADSSIFRRDHGPTNAAG